MTAYDVLDEARKRGIVLQPDGDGLVYRGPKGAMTPELKDSLTRYKGEIINHILSHADQEPPRHMLDIWIEAAIPEWKRILRESNANGDESRAAYSRGLLRQLGVQGY